MAQILSFETAIRFGMVLGASAVIRSMPTEPQVTASLTINVTEEGSPHPLVALLGKYREEPLWDGFEEAIRKLREEESST